MKIMCYRMTSSHNAKHVKDSRTPVIVSSTPVLDQWSRDVSNYAFNTSNKWLLTLRETPGSKSIPKDCIWHSCGTPLHANSRSQWSFSGRSVQDEYSRQYSRVLSSTGLVAWSTRSHRGHTDFSAVEYPSSGGWVGVEYSSSTRVKY